MNNLQRIKTALDYLECHLTEPIHLKDIAREACFSEYHFHRLFRALTGYTLKDYIRRRRLFLAAVDIANQTDSLASIAQKYQFSSQPSFTVAFKQMHGITPGEVKNKGVSLQSFGRMILNETSMNRPSGMTKEPSLVEMDSMTVTGIECSVRYSQLQLEDNPIGGLWKASELRLSMLQGPLDRDFIVAVYQYDPRDIHREDLSFTYMLGYRGQLRAETTEMMVQRILPAGAYLRFQIDQEEGDLTEAYGYIDGQWIPHSDYILSDKPDFELHPQCGSSNQVEIYISVE